MCSPNRWEATCPHQRRARVALGWSRWRYPTGPGRGCPSGSGSGLVVIEQPGSVVSDYQVKFADGFLDSPGHRMVTHQAQCRFEGKSGGEQPVHHHLVNALADPEMILRLVHDHRRRVACRPGRGTAHWLYYAGLIHLEYRHAEGRCCVHRWHLGSYPAADWPCRQGPATRSPAPFGLAQGSVMDTSPLASLRRRSALDGHPLPAPPPRRGRDRGHQGCRLPANGPGSGAFQPLNRSPMAICSCAPR